MYNIQYINIIAKYQLIDMKSVSHAFLEMVTREYVYDILYSAKEAHMNMLRVWGGKNRNEIF